MIQPNDSSRRDFLKTSAVFSAAAALPSALTQSAQAKPTSEKLKIGFIGCGGRGTGAAGQALHADSNVVLHAMGDVFPEKIGKSLEALKHSVKNDAKFDVPAERQFSGLDAYQKVLASDVDLVILTTPPGFRPLHFAAAIEAGKHVFLEKPMATDGPGLRSVMETVKKSKAKNLAVVAGFCWRYDLARRAIFQEIHNGAIGDIRALYHTYLTGPVKAMPPAADRPPGMGDVEWQVRNWYNFTWLSGDGLVEQAIHSIDKMAWTMKDEPPFKCTAVGGRMTQNHEGNIYDHIEVNFEWSNGVRGFLAQRQIPHCASEVRDTMMGTKGIAYIGRRNSSPVEIVGEKNWKYTGPTPDMYQVEHDELFASIRAGKPLNNGDRMCSSTMMGIMGRMAAYTGQEITWEQALNSQEKLVPDNLTWDQKLPIMPMAIPGVKKFI